MLAIAGARLIDGTGGSVIENSVVLIDHYRIIARERKGEVDIPQNADVYDATGMTVLPGFIDAHYHSINNNFALHRILENGTTAFRDLNHPFRFYISLDFATEAMPRAFLTGAHLDGCPGDYKDQAVLVKNSGHAREVVENHGSEKIRDLLRLTSESSGVRVL